MGGEPTTPSFNGSAILKNSSVVSYALVLNCENYSENYTFANNIIPQISIVSADGTVVFAQNGTPVNWYGNNKNDYNGAQYIIDFSVFKNLQENVIYTFNINFKINGISYTQDINMNGVVISLGDSGLNINFSNTANGLTMKLI